MNKIRHPLRALLEQQLKEEKMDFDIIEGLLDTLKLLCKLEPVPVRTYLATRDIEKRPTLGMEVEAFVSHLRGEE